jgi:hypothetical protein
MDDVAHHISVVVHLAENVVDVLMNDGLFTGPMEQQESTTQRDNQDASRRSNRNTTPVATITRQVDFENLPSEKERRQDIVEGIHFHSGSANQSGEDKRKAPYLDNESLKGKTQHLRQIPVRAGGPYLCDSDSDVTVPICVVEELETVEDEEE